MALAGQGLAPLQNAIFYCTASVGFAALRPPATVLQPSRLVSGEFNYIDTLSRTRYTVGSGTVWKWHERPAHEPRARCACHTQTTPLPPTVRLLDALLAYE
jgi:hypothetical protein